MNDSRLLRVLRQAQARITVIDGDAEIECPTCEAPHFGDKVEHEPDCELQAEIEAEEARLEDLNRANCPRCGNPGHQIAKPPAMEGFEGIVRTCKACGSGFCW